MIDETLPRQPATPHPWGRTFRWRDRSGPFAYLSAEQVVRFDRDGFLVVPEVFANGELDLLVANADINERRLDRQLRRHPGGRRGISHAGAFAVLKNPARPSVMARLTLHPVMLGICHDLLGRDVDVFDEQAVYKRNETAHVLPWHQDIGYTYLDPPGYLVIWVAATDATIDNGCLQFAPGLHRRGPLLHTQVRKNEMACFEDFPAPVIAPVSAGGLVVQSSLVPHTSGPNRTDRPRKAFIVRYARAGSVQLVASATPSRDPVRVALENRIGPRPVLRRGRGVTRWR